MKVLVTGGTGHLGTDLVRFLQHEGHHVRVLARNPGRDPAVEWVKGDLATGVGVAEAVAGTHTIVHAATLSPSARRGYPLPTDFLRSPSQVDVDGTSRILAEAAGAGVEHLLYVSVVGVDSSRIPYMRVKFAAENLVRESPVPWTIARATGFYWLFDRMMSKMARLPVWMMPTDLEMQPVDSKEFAAFLAGAVSDGPRGDRREFGGPEIISVGRLAKEFREARGLRRPILGLPLPESAKRAALALTCPDGRRGETTWAEWLARRTTAPARGRKTTGSVMPI